MKEQTTSKRQEQMVLLVAQLLAMDKTPGGKEKGQIQQQRINELGALLEGATFDEIDAAHKLVRAENVNLLQ